MVFASLSLAVTRYNTCNREFQGLFNATHGTGTNLQAPSFILSQHSLGFAASEPLLWSLSVPETKHWKALWQKWDSHSRFAKGWTEECGFTGGTGSHCWFRGRGGFYFMYMSILPTYIIVFHMGAQYPGRLEKSFRSPKTGVTDDHVRYKVCAGNQAQVLWESSRCS